MKLTENLAKNVEYLKQILASDDLSFLDMKVDKRDAVLIFVNDLIHKDSVGRLILEPASRARDIKSKESLISLFL